MSNPVRSPLATNTGRLKLLEALVGSLAGIGKNTKLGRNEDYQKINIDNVKNPFKRKI